MQEDRVFFAFFMFVCAEWCIFCFVCFRSVSCVPNVDSFCGLSILLMQRLCTYQNDIKEFTIHIENNKMMIFLKKLSLKTRIMTMLSPVILCCHQFLLNTFNLILYHLFPILCHSNRLISLIDTYIVSKIAIFQ